jgi:hypothetical protein
MSTARTQDFVIRQFRAVGGGLVLAHCRAPTRGAPTGLGPPFALFEAWTNRLQMADNWSKSFLPLSYYSSPVIY